MRTIAMIILLASAYHPVCGDELTATPGILWEYGLTHSDMMSSVESLIGSSEMTLRASGRIPDPFARFGWSPFPVQTRNGPAEFSITLMQKIPWPGYLSGSSSLAESAVESARIDRDIAALELRTSITELWSEMYLLRGSQDFLDGEMSRLQILHSTASSRYEVGEENLSSLLRLKNRIAMVEADQFLIKLTLEAVSHQMNSLIGRSMYEELIWPDSLPGIESFQWFYQSGIETFDFPLARRSSIEFESARLSEELSAELTKPSFEIGVTWSIISEPSIGMGAVEEGGDGLAVFAGMSLPLGYSGSGYSHRAAQYSAESAEFSHSQRLADLSSMRAEISAQIGGLINMYSSYEVDVVPNLEVILSLAESAWMTGESDLIHVIEVTGELRAAHLEMLNIYSQIVVSSAKLKELTGEATERGEFL